VVGLGAAATFVFHVLSLAAQTGHAAFIAAA
jgi:hypothetical protein